MLKDAEAGLAHAGAALVPIIMMMKTPDRMSRLVQLAEQIRAVRQAQRQFLTLWAIDGVRERVLSQTDPESRLALADPHNRDWSLLYRGNILDD